LLDKGSHDVEGYTASVINITSISGILKIAQNHVSAIAIVAANGCNLTSCQFCYNSSKAAASHLTKMFATELALKSIPIRVNAIAPGVYASEITMDNIISPEDVDEVAQSLLPVPARRAGT